MKLAKAWPEKSWNSWLSETESQEHLKLLPAFRQKLGFDWNNTITKSGNWETKWVRPADSMQCKLNDTFTIFFWISVNYWFYNLKFQLYSTEEEAERRTRQVEQLQSKDIQIQRLYESKTNDLTLSRSRLLGPSTSAFADGGTTSWGIDDDDEEPLIDYGNASVSDLKDQKQQLLQREYLFLSKLVQLIHFYNDNLFISRTRGRLGTVVKNNFEAKTDCSDHTQRGR